MRSPVDPAAAICGIVPAGKTAAIIDMLSPRRKSHEIY
jgi:hypothetical protein